MLYANHYNPRRTPQSEQADQLQVQNNAGGYTFAVDDWMRLQRFLILGSEGGTYYATEHKLTRDNAKCVERCIDADPARAVQLIVDISLGGRAPKNDPAIFALALAAATPGASKLAMAALPSVCRTGTHLFQFIEQVRQMRGWGVALRRGVSAWYEQKNPDDLMYQLVKYQQRNGMDHKRIFRMAHPRLGDSAIARWVLGASNDARQVGKDGERSYGAAGIVPEYLAAFDELKTADEKRTIQLIQQYRFTHEMIATHHRNSAAVWEALLPTMPMTALIRNLGKLSSVGLTKPMGQTTGAIVSKLTNGALLKHARVHPISVLSALRVYESGHGDKGSLTWEASRQVIDALDEAFYLAFGSIEPTGKRTLLALDVSGSMDGSRIAGLSLSAREVSAALAMVTARTEQNWYCMGFSTRFMPLNISPKQRLGDVIRVMQGLPFAGTDCAQPMLWAAGSDVDVDVFHVYTDNETWAGNIHPHQALKAYRAKSGINAKLAVVGMTATEFSIANPSDPGMLDCVGCDSALPNVLADFARW